MAPAEAEQIWPGGVPASWQGLIAEPGPTARERAGAVLSRAVGVLALVPAGGAVIVAVLSATGETLSVLGHLASLAPLGRPGEVVTIVGLAAALGRIGWHVARLSRRWRPGPNPRPGPRAQRPAVGRSSSNSSKRER